MTIQDLLQAQVTCRNDAKAITAIAEKEKRELTAEESKTHGEHTAKFDALSLDLANARDKQDERSAIRAKEIEMDASLATSPGRQTTPPPIGEVPPTAATRAVVKRERILGDPKKGFKSEREFYGALIFAGQNPSRPKPDGLKVLDAGRFKGAEQFHIEATAGSDEAGTYSDPYGGFLVPEGFTPGFLKIDPEPDPIAGRTRMIPMNAPSIPMTARVDKDHSTSVSGGLTVSRRAETAANSATRIEFEKFNMVAHGLFGFSYATEELLTDSPQSWAALLAGSFSDQFTSHLIDERINGSGVGKFEGVTNSDAFLSIDPENGQTADTIVYENIIEMRSRCWGYNNAVWMANHNCLPQLMLMNQSVGASGVPVWSPGGALADHPDVLLGRPLILTEYTKTVGDANDIMLINWNEYLEGIYQPMQSAESIHVRFSNHERTFKFWLRNDGRSWWRSKLTPKNGSTMSPFIGLGART